ncbi:MAG: helix-hairpin-helix domain-containing protein [Candidatus Electrothrix gigas]
MAEKNADRDFRLLVLLVLAASILVAHSPSISSIWLSWFYPVSGQQVATVATYYYVPAVQAERPAIIRMPQDQELPTGAVAITSDIPCGKVPAEISWLFHLPLPVNQADQESLMLLPGIGPVLAQRIVAFRDAQGPITGPADFIRVKGIGPKLTARLTPLLCFSKTGESAK